MIITNKEFKNKKYSFVYEEKASKIKIKLISNDIGYVKINNLILINNNSTVYLEVSTPQLMKIESSFSNDSCFKLIFEKVNKDANIIFELDEKINNLVIERNYAFYNYEGFNPISHFENLEINKKSKFIVFNYTDTWYETFYFQNGIPVIKGNIMTLKNLFLDYYFDNVIVKDITKEILFILYGYTNVLQKKCFISYGFENLELDAASNRYFLNRKDKFLDSMFVNILKYYLNSNNTFWIARNSNAFNFYKNNFNKSLKLVENLFTRKCIYNPENLDIVLNLCFDNNTNFKADTTLLILKELLNNNKLASYNFHVGGFGNFKSNLISILPKKENLFLHDNYIDLSKYNVLLEFNIKSSYGFNECSNHLLVLNDSILSLYSDNNNLIVNSDYIFSAKKISEFILKQKKNITICYDDNFENIDVDKIVEFLNAKSISNNVIKANKPILSIVIPAYNIERYLSKCLNSLVYAKNIGDCEILVINDGSSDNTLSIARNYEKRFKNIVKVIDKENGGHGSGINVGMKIAKGKYFKILDSDDWVDINNFEKLVDKLKEENADLVLTRVRCEYFNTMDLPLQVDYEKLQSDVTYRFEDLLNENYGISSGILFAASCYKTEKLRNANFQITKKKLYTDHEFDAFSVKCVDTVKLYDLDIYMYLIGRDGQSISNDVWQKKYPHHQSAMIKVLEKLYDDTEITDIKKFYALKYVVNPMLIHQIESLIIMKKEKEIFMLINKIKIFDSLYEELCNEIKFTHPQYYKKYFLDKNNKMSGNSKKSLKRMILSAFK